VGVYEVLEIVKLMQRLNVIDFRVRNSNLKRGKQNKRAFCIISLLFEISSRTSLRFFSVKFTG
jgi:hypothetical protein